MKKVFLILVSLVIACGTCFGQTEITSAEDAKHVFKLVFDASDKEISSLGAITTQDLEMATQLLRELATKSAHLKIASNFISISKPGVSSVFVAIVKSIKDYNSQAGAGKYNEASRVTLKRNFKSCWESRKLGGPWC